MEGFTRITDPLLDVVQVLIDAHQEDEDLHGWAIMEKVRRAGPTVYRILDRLEDAHLVDTHWEDKNPMRGKPPRRFYRLNPSGLAQARQLLAERRPARDAARAAGPRLGLNVLFAALTGAFGGARD